MSVKLSAKWVIKLYFKQKGRCEYCKKLFTELFLPTADHIISKNSIWTSNNINNICLACEECNLAKADLSYNEFIWLKKK
jgi:5-methylcytosine-specific restriction endonuclease McrA